MTGSLTRANALPPPMSPSLASSLAPRQIPGSNAWAGHHLIPRYIGANVLLTSDYCSSPSRRTRATKGRPRAATCSSKRLRRRSYHAVSVGIRSAMACRSKAFAT